MIGQNLLRKSLASQSKYASMVGTPARAFSATAKKAAIDAKETNFDVVFVGKSF